MSGSSRRRAALARRRERGTRFLLVERRGWLERGYVVPPPSPAEIWLRRLAAPLWLAWTRWRVRRTWTPERIIEGMQRDEHVTTAEVEAIQRALSRWDLDGIEWPVPTARCEAVYRDREV